MRFFVNILLAVTILSFNFLSSKTWAGPEPLLINGAGATFPYPLYSKWFSEFHKNHPETEINYSSIGSGGGIRQLIDGTIDFGASDTPMTGEQMSRSKKSVIHIPTVLGAVVITYNLPSVKEPLKMTSDLVVDIYLGRIQKWNDPKISTINPGLKLPDMEIIPVYRSDGSGTTGIFSDYLSKVSPEWKTKVGSGTSLHWPKGIGGKGNEGVTALISQAAGRMGYVELLYAKSNKVVVDGKSVSMPVAQIKNRSGKFVIPDLKSVSSAAAGFLKDMPEDFRISITDPAAEDAYPIASFTFLIVFKEMSSPKGQKIVDFLNWTIGPGQSFATNLNYAPLPKSMAEKVRQKIKAIQVR